MFAEGYNSMTCIMLADQDVYTSKQLFLLPPTPPPLDKYSIFNSKKNSSWNQLSGPSDSPPTTPPTKFMPLSDPGHISYQQLLSRMFIDQQFSINPNFSFAQNLPILLAMQNHPPTSNCNGKGLYLNEYILYTYPKIKNRSPKFKMVFRLRKRGQQAL
jgi:hypothetical protein